MARQARGEYLNPNEVQVVHCVQGEEGDSQGEEEKAEGDTRKRVDAKLLYPYNRANLPLIYGG